jgi:hypothetical protein
VGGLIALDIGIPDPSDVLVPKWVGYAIAYTLAFGIDKIILDPVPIPPPLYVQPQTKDGEEQAIPKGKDEAVPIPVPKEATLPEKEICCGNHPVYKYLDYCEDLEKQGWEYESLEKIIKVTGLSKPRVIGSDAFSVPMHEQARIYT